ncbi:hypothetical protein D910_00027 [Dendroctonus ponderosae]
MLKFAAGADNVQIAGSSTVDVGGRAAQERRGVFAQPPSNACASFSHQRLRVENTITAEP